MTDPRTLLVRADAGPGVGLGHAMRCLGLAQAWRALGGRAVFALEAAAAAVRRRIESGGFRVVTVPAPAGGRPDAETTVRSAQDVEAAWLVLDGYRFDRAYHEAVQAASARILWLDDLGAADARPADLIVNPAFEATPALYPSQGPSSRLLLGPRYALLRQEFWPHRSRQSERGDAAQNLLVTLGGEDSKNAVSLVLAALQELAGDAPLRVRIVVGSTSSGAPPGLPENPPLPFPCEFVVDPPDMAALLEWSDVAVSAAGSTCWELAFMGVPSLLLVTADNQVENGRQFERRGTATNLGRIESLRPTDLAGALRRLLDDPGARRAMARRGRALVDGFGPNRVLRAMVAPDVRLRPATHEDARAIWEISNDPEVRAASYDSAPIPWETHVQWLASRLTDPRTVLLVGTDARGVAVGQVRFDVDGRRAIVSVSLAAALRGTGYGTELLREASRRVLGGGAVDAIDAYVKEENRASVRAFLHAGYAEAARETVKGHRSVRLALRRSE